MTAPNLRRGADVPRTSWNRARLPLLLGVLAGLATGCSGSDAQPWHYWISIVLFASALGVALIALPVGYYLKVWRLKQRGR